MVRPHVDPFAAKDNHQLPAYFARGRDQGAMGADALSQSWAGVIGYAFPPIALIPRVLIKVAQTDGCLVLLVAPWWPRQPWFVTLTDLLVAEPVSLPERQGLLAVRALRMEIPLRTIQSLHLTVWTFSSSHSKRRDFLRRLPSSLERQGDLVRVRLIIIDSVKYVRWCRSGKECPFTASIGRVADFLVHIYDTGAQARTVQGYRTAIGAVRHGFPDGSSVASNANLSSLIKGIFNERPPKRSLLPEWDLPLALRCIASDMASLHDMSLTDLSRRTVFLRRCSDVHALSVSGRHLSVRRRAVVMLPRAGFWAKNQSLDFTPSPIVLPDLRLTTGSPDDAPWCPVRSLKFYMSRTKAIKKGVDQLFISSRPPHSPASKATIARWVREVICSAYKKNELMTPAFTPHTTRAVGRSWALYRGATLSDIVTSAGWRGDTTFQRIYMRDVLADPGEVQVNAAAAVLTAGRGNKAV